MKRFAAAACLALSASPALAQQSIPELLNLGVDAYQKSNVEAAKNYFETILASRQQVTNDQRVTAYKYLGAYWALQSSPGARDSANNFFLAAIDLDPFTDLDRTNFAADEQAAFARARNALFKIGIQPIQPKALDPSIPDSARYTFRVISTRSSRMTASIVRLNDPANTQEVLATMSNSQGVSDIVWNGLVNNTRADTGLYEFRLEAQDNVRGGTPITERQRFRVEHVRARLEDTLPSFRDVELGGTDTLRSRRPTATPYLQGARGAIIGSLAVILPQLALSQAEGMSQKQSHLRIGIAIGAVAGAGAAWYAASHRDDARALAENARRRNARAQFNAAVLARNRARIDKTILVIRPLTAGTAG